MDLNDERRADRFIQKSRKKWLQSGLHPPQGDPQQDKYLSNIFVQSDGRFAVRGRKERTSATEQQFIEFKEVIK
jgi:hypothetical protein